MQSNTVITRNALAGVLFGSLAYMDKQNGVEDSPYTQLSPYKGNKPLFLDKRNAHGEYKEEVNQYLEVMYRYLVSEKDPLISKFFRMEINSKNFLVWLRCKESSADHEGKIIEAGDWHPISKGQGIDMGLIPNRDVILKLFEKGEWESLVSSFFKTLKRRLNILASFRSDIITEIISIYLGEEELRWTTKVS